MTAKPKITLIGGGTGSYTLLQALKLITPNVTALVNMADDGGSTGLLRDELGVLPPGDVRQCLVALSDAPQELRDLFNFRFPAGGLKGHSFGNIFLSAVESMTHNFDDSVRLASDILRITGKVLPITLDECELMLAHGSSIVTGQRAIELTNLPTHSYPVMSYAKTPCISRPAVAAIAEADLVVIAPGNLYASLAPALIVDGVSEALSTTKAKIAFVCNLVNKPNHTQDFSVADYAQEIERFTAPGVLDYVLYNEDIPSPQLLEKYALDREYPVEINQPLVASSAYALIGGRFLSHSPIDRDPNDHLILRSLIRHDAKAVVGVLSRLLRA